MAVDWEVICSYNVVIDEETFCFFSSKTERI